ncbi:hypothetical protein SLEP1_g17206 [Rubroshorea leprosula]|uniref:Protein FAR1-RELATED SEQUENCE n=1 Tax=Rubroshorea leprosula TaxID=152421 RepID=A0AAV5IZ10_9ROSI|nr:hypothetical protein SLEP1_g17206 [Rubroshorea leprosula]
MSGEDGITSWMPHEAMQFPSEKEAREFYNEYVRRVGFSIRIESSKRSTSYGPIDRKYYVCYKASKKRPYVPKYKLSCERPIRVGCKTPMSLHFKNGVWIIIHFVDEHNHELFSSPNKIRKLRSHNKEHLLQETRELMDQYKLAGCGPSKIARVLNVTGQGNSNITPQQCQEHLRKKRESNISREWLVVMQQFLEMTASNENFYHSMELDEDGVCRSMFWADGRAREMYQHFGDVVVFDMTYRTNQFLLPFAPFTSMNHHGQSTPFGCALLPDETEATFVWLFKQWLSCMGGKELGAIITDQDLAITNAIKKVFPNTRHRALQSRCDQEVNEDMQTMKAKPDPLNLHPIEVQVGNIYTRKIFDKFQSEFKACFYCMHDEVNTCDGVTTYVVTYELGKMVDSQFVRCGPSAKEFACTCGKFETAGHRDHYNAIAPLLDDMMKQLDRVDKQHEGLVLEQNVSTPAISQGAISSNITIRDLERAKTKGRPRELGRIPSGKQVSQKASQARMRTCSMCGIKGHDARTCGKTKQKVEANDSLSQPLHEKE